MQLQAHFEIGFLDWVSRLGLESGITNGAV